VAKWAGMTDSANSAGARIALNRSRRQVMIRHVNQQRGRIMTDDYRRIEKAMLGWEEA